MKIKALACALLVSAALPANAVTIDFETYGNGSATSYGAISSTAYDAYGITFSDAYIQTCGGGCPDPDHGHFVSSSSFVDPFSVAFAGPISSFSFVNVSGSNGTASAYDADNALISSVDFSDFLQLSTLTGTGITHIVFSTSGAFGVDNFTFDAPSGSVPEPASWAMMLGGFGLVGGAMRSRRKAAVSFG